MSSISIQDTRCGTISASIRDLGHRSGKGIDLKEYAVLPSILTDCYWSKELSFEFELGATNLERAARHRGQ
jgi:hypothetical protein